MSWLRWWDGTCSDPKWRVIAARSGQPVGDIVAVWAWLLERARQADGDVGDVDVEEIAVTYGYEVDNVASILKALADKGLIGEGAIKNWRKRQPKREDDSRERVKAWRAAKACNESVTHCNAPEAEAETETTVAIAPVVERAKRRTRIDQNWQPSESGLSSASSRGMSESDIRREVPRFVNHHVSKGSVMASWDAAWITWIDSPYRQGNRNTGPPSRQSNNSRALDALDEVIPNGPVQPQSFLRIAG
jgi:hypothetical protein